MQRGTARRHVRDGGLDRVAQAHEVDRHHVDLGPRAGQARAVEEPVDRPTARRLRDEPLDRACVAQVDLEEALVLEAGRLLDVGGHDRAAEALDDPRGRLPHPREAAREEATLARVAEQVLHRGTLLCLPDAMLPKSTGSDVGDRNTCPRMCGSSPSGSRRRSGRRSSRRFERDAHLEPGQMHPEADVDPMAPRDVGLWRAEDVEAVGIRIPILVPVGGTEHEHDRRARWDRAHPRAPCLAWPRA